MMPRVSRMKWVLGRASPSHCATSGMPSNGNMKPDRSIDGSRMNTVICIAWNWVRAAVDMNNPSARFAAINAKAAR